jgi:hypothetical protein
MKLLGELILALKILEDVYGPGGLHSTEGGEIWLRGEGPIDKSADLATRGCDKALVPPHLQAELNRLGVWFFPCGSLGAWVFSGRGSGDN